MIPVKPLSYYQNLHYPIIIEKDDDRFIAYCNELGKYACYGLGKSRELALQSFIVEKEEYIELLYNLGKSIPDIKEPNLDLM